MPDRSHGASHPGASNCGEDLPARSEVRSLAGRFACSIANSACNACNGYYGPAHGQSVCPTCHAFLYANDLDNEVNVQLASVERDGEGSDSDRDSGNDEPSDYFCPMRMQRQNQAQVDPDEEPAAVGGQDDLDQPLVRVFRPFFCPNDHVNRAAARQNHFQPVHMESLNQRLAQLSLPKCEGYLNQLPENLVDALPPEVLMVIFSFLDDISLFAVGHVCRRWHQLLESQTTPDEWFVYTRHRWPLFKPVILISDWFAAYSALVESSFCLTCIYQMAEEVTPAHAGALPLRKKRLFHDLRGLVSDASEGIKAQPLDSSHYHWQASITGPVGSPYEGGIFFLYLKVPLTYPFDPPEVRFLTRIFHPNVSRHGDIGIDSIQQHNWVSGLTISKVLISIQSLLTDPFTDVCMEPEIGELYRHKRPMFEAVARQWTWKYAMWDALPAKKKM